MSGQLLPLYRTVLLNYNENMHKNKAGITSEWDQMAKEDEKDEETKEISGSDAGSGFVPGASECVRQFG